MTRDEIAKEMHRIKMARHDKMNEAMREYDENIHLPAIHGLQTQCSNIGHVKGRFNSNGLGYYWYNCQYCNARMEVATVEWNTVSIINNSDAT